MFCKECGKVIPDGAKRCSFCGALLHESGPRHARPDPDDDLYSYSDRHLSDEKDSTRVYDPDHEKIDETKVYHLGAFEDSDLGYDDRYDNEYDPRYDPGYDPDYDPAYGPMGPDDPVSIGDNYENYQDGESDDTFMDRMDDRFRRDDDDYPRRKKSKAWLWILLSVIAVILIAVILVFAFSGKLFGNNKKPAPTTAQATTLATAKPKATQAPATQAPAETQAPETQAPETEPPVVTMAPTPTQAPATQAPTPTQAPETNPPATNPPTESAQSEIGP